MKTLVMVCTLMFVCSFSVLSFASDGTSSELGSQPCMQIKKACESGGVLRGKLKLKDCIKKITSGEKVAGVTVSSDVIQSCKEKHEK